ncbi:hypothetical protein SSKA14_689 [Stenotrophomonas sp. SKA14]|nr:hypothetical protein SSKA14_689 [Stenotrophomonas sp. SKA14]
MVGSACVGVKPGVRRVQLNAVEGAERAPNLLMHKEHHTK